MLPLLIFSWVFVFGLFFFASLLKYILNHTLLLNYRSYLLLCLLDVSVMATLRSATWGRDQPLTLRGGKCVAVSTTQTGSTARSVSPCSTTSRGLEPQRAVPMNAHVSQHSGINREREGGRGH